MVGGGPLSGGAWRGVSAPRLRLAGPSRRAVLMGRRGMGVVGELRGEPGHSCWRLPNKAPGLPDMALDILFPSRSQEAAQTRLRA